MCAKRQNHDHRFPLTSDHVMLLHIRDTLYEGHWQDFVDDLESRAEGRPRVFETVPQSPTMKDTIQGHLGLISGMRAWEAKHGRLAPSSESTDSSD